MPFTKSIGTIKTSSLYECDQLLGRNEGEKVTENEK
jgi:hypothetical protein